MTNRAVAGRRCPGDVVLVVTRGGTGHISVVVQELETVVADIIGVVCLVAIGPLPGGGHIRYRGDVIAKLRLRLERNVLEKHRLDAISMDRLIGHDHGVITKAGIGGVMAAGTTAVVGIVPDINRRIMAGIATDDRRRPRITVRARDGAARCQQSAGPCVDVLG
ncbi:MAG: hypothetical protein JRE16_08245, partial [Deltaproteobacteria bacterium]|nr:hypothetical protein [Deltaproteobacteria bacterium]